MKRMIKASENCRDCGWKIRYTYPGDSLSDYEATCIILREDKEDALRLADNYIKDGWNFRVDEYIPSYSKYTEQYPHSNLEVIKASTEYEVPIVFEYNEDNESYITVEAYNEDTGIYFDINTYISYDEDIDDDCKWCWSVEDIDIDTNGFEHSAQGYDESLEDAKYMVESTLTRWLQP